MGVCLCVTHSPVALSFQKDREEEIIMIPFTNQRPENKLLHEFRTQKNANLVQFLHASGFSVVYPIYINRSFKPQLQFTEIHSPA